MDVIEPTREIRNCAMDSRRWTGFPFRDGDIVVATFSKSGTTLSQQVVRQLLSNGGGSSNLPAAPSPWVDCFFHPGARELAEAIPGRRLLKSHLPADALPIDHRAKYINVGRDPRDVFWSWHHHHASFTDGFYEYANSLPGRVGPGWARPEPDIRKAYLAWLEQKDEPHGGYCKHVQSWWDLRDRPNVLLTHYNEYKTNLEGTARRIAAFLEVEIDEEALPAILEHCSLDHMRNAARSSEQLRQTFKEGGDSFFYKGTNGRWRDVLTADEAALADRMVERGLTPDCAQWIRTGAMAVPA